MKATRHIKRFGVVMAVALVAVGALAGAALASETDAEAAIVNGTLTAGPLQIDSIQAVTFGSEILTGRAKSFTATGDSGTIVVTDATGSGLGYQVQAIRDDLSTAGGTHTLDGLFAMSAASVTKVDNGSNTAPVPAAQTIDTSVPVNIAVAAPNTGMGSYNLTFGVDHAITMGITADDYAGLYTGTLTITTASGPGS
jgi:hypothetical protein